MPMLGVMRRLSARSWWESPFFLDIFAGIAAFFGSFINMNYLLASTVSTNPILFALTTLLVLARKAAGWCGLDRWVLPALGTLWRPGVVFRERKAAGGQPGGLRESMTWSSKLPVWSWFLCCWPHARPP